MADCEWGSLMPVTTTPESDLGTPAPPASHLQATSSALGGAMHSDAVCGVGPGNPTSLQMAGQPAAGRWGCPALRG